MKMNAIRRSYLLGSRIRRLEALVLVLGCILISYACSSSTKTDVTEETPPTIVQNTPDPNLYEAKGNGPEYAKFPHNNEVHNRLPCLLCHRRDDDAPKLKRSDGHTPCIGCHQAQFAVNSSPICTICHSPGSVDVKPFPPLRSFGVRFNHSVHVSQTNCATCHRSDMRGVGLTVPSGANAHATCFQCHTANKIVGEKNIGSCDTCHFPGRLQKGPSWVKAYAANFSHQEHVRGAKLNCAACHNVRAGFGSKQVSAPIVSEHFPPKTGQSCASCHNNKRAFGPQDFDNCKRCHEGSSFKI